MNKTVKANILKIGTWMVIYEFGKVHNIVYIMFNMPFFSERKGKHYRYGVAIVISGNIMESVTNFTLT